MEVEIQKQAPMNVKVAVRIRPLSSKELQAKESECVESNSQSINFIQSQRQFNFDHVFNQQSDQETIFQSCVVQLVLRCFDGYNSTLLAYGQTGSGKTYTMGTTGIYQPGTQQVNVDMNQIGMIPRVIQFIYDEIEKRKEIYDIFISCSYVELYNEQIIDLLDETSIQDKCPPQIREEKDHTISILNLQTVSVSTPFEMLQVLNKGGLHRTTATTQMNLSSSRSHAIFTIYFQVNPKDESDLKNLSAKFHFVDLAGSERLKKTQAIGKTMEEGININQSLLVLGNVIKTLSENKKGVTPHIPYRESKLTRILQDSLGGNANTCMIACVSPAESNYEETLNSLKYASRAREIQNKPVQNIDPHAAQIISLKQQIQDLESQNLQILKLLEKYNVPCGELKFQKPAESHVESQQVRQHISILEKQIQQQQLDLNLLSRTKNEYEIQCYNMKRQRDVLSKQLQDAKKLLSKNNIQGLQTEETNIFEAYTAEIQSLKIMLSERDAQLNLLQKDFDILFKDQKRDQIILVKKQKEIFNLEKKVKELRDRLPDDSAEISEEEEYIDEEFPELDQMEVDLQEAERDLQSNSLQTDEFKKQLAEEMKKEYFTQISMLEQQKAQLIKQVSNKQQDVGQVNQLKGKVQELESKIQELKFKDQNQKQLQKKLDDQESYVRDLKGNIEKIKRQKVDLLKKIKEENDKFVKFKELNYKEMMIVKKQKFQQEAQMRKLKNDNYKKDLLIKRKDGELYKQKNDKIITKHIQKANHSKLLDYSQFEQQIDQVVQNLVEAMQAEHQIEKIESSIIEKSEEIQLLEGRICQLQIQKEQQKYEFRPQYADSINQMEIEISNLHINRETLNETIDFQMHKINSYREQVTKYHEFYQIFLQNQYFKELPQWLARSIKFMIDNWVQNNFNFLQVQQLADELQQQVTDLENASRPLQNIIPENNQSPVKKKIIKLTNTNTNMEQNDLKKQLNDCKKKYQNIQLENKSILMDLEYYKKFYQQYFNKNQKTKDIGISKSEAVIDTSQLIQNNYYQQRELFRQEKSKNKQSQSMSFSNSNIQQQPSSLKIQRMKSSAEKSADQWIMDQVNLNHSQDIELSDLKYELVKAVHGHESQILCVYSWENLLISSSFKTVKIWDIESQHQVSSIDLNGYVRSICYWPERHSFAISHGSLVSIYDQSTLTHTSTMKTYADEIKCLQNHNGLLVSAGKGLTNSAIYTWDHRSNNVLYEFEKGMDILTLASCESSHEIYWGTLNHNVKHMQLNQQSYSPIGLMHPPHFDKVTGVGVLDNWIVSCAFGKSMKAWNRFNHTMMKENSDIHKDNINCLTIDQQLKVVYTGSKDGQVKAIKLNNKFQQIHEISCSTQSINSLNVIQQNSCLATGGSDKIVKIWRPSKSTYELLRQNIQVSEFQIDEEYKQINPLISEVQSIKKVTNQKQDDKEKLTIKFVREGDKNQMLVMLEPQDMQTAMKFQIDSIKTKAANNNYKWEIFDIKQEIGAGTFGQVFASLDQKTQKKYALKFIGYEEENDQDPEFKSAVREIVIMQQLSQSTSKGILKIFDVYPCIRDDNKYLVIVMELCDCNLMELLKVRIEENKTKWADEELLFILYQLVEGFLVMKQNFITHRDIKPQNILYSVETQSYKIADLGGAKFLKPKQTYDQLNTVRGSPAYWAPEIYYYCDLQKDKDGRFFVGKQHLQYDPYNSDVYSLGITFLLMRKLVPRVDREQLKVEVEALKKIKNPTFFEVILAKLLEFDEQKRTNFEDLYKLLKENQNTFKQPNEDVFVNCLKTQQDKKNLSPQDLMLREVKLAEAYEKLNLIEHAKTHFEVALKYANKLNKDINKADVYNSLGTVNCYLGLFDEAERYYQDSLILYKKINGDKHTSVADAYNNLGIVKRKKGEFEKAISYYECAYKIKEHVFGENNLGSALILSNIGLAYRKLGNLEMAIKYYRNALQIKKLLCGDRSLVLCGTYDNLARVYYLKQQFDLAISCYMITIEIYRKSISNTQFRLSDALFELGLCFQKIGRYLDGIRQFEESFQIRKQLLGLYNKQTIQSYEHLAQCCLEEGNYAKSLEYYLELKRLYSSEQLEFEYSEKLDSLADIMKNLGAAYQGIKQYENTISSYNEAISYLQKRQREFKHDESSRLAKIYYNLGIVFRIQKQYIQAVQNYEKAINQIIQSKQTSDIILIGDTYNNMGALYGMQEQYEKAKAYFIQSLEKYTNALGKNHKLSKEVETNIQEVDKWLARKRN